MVICGVGGGLMAKLFPNLGTLWVHSKVFFHSNVLLNSLNRIRYLRQISLNPISPGVLCSVAQSCPTLYDPMDCSPPGSSVHGILQARILEWVAMLSSRGSSQPRNRTQVSHIAGGLLTIWVTKPMLLLLLLLLSRFSRVRLCATA